MNSFTDRIYVAGHRTMEGSAIVRQLLRVGHPKSHIITSDDTPWALNHPMAFREFLQRTQPQQMYLPLSGIRAAIDLKHPTPSELNRAITAPLHALQSAADCGVKKVLLLLDNEVYPAQALQPLAEEDLLGGPLRPQSEMASLSMIMAMKYLELSTSSLDGAQLDCRCAVRGSVYGMGDDYGRHTQQPVAALIHQVDLARESGLEEIRIAARADDHVDVLFVDDLAEASMYLMEQPRRAFDAATAGHYRHVNIGLGHPVSMQRLVDAVVHSCGYPGTYVFSEEPGLWSRARLMDCNRLNRMDWHALIDIDQGVDFAFLDYRLHHARRESTARILM